VQSGVFRWFQDFVGGWLFCCFIVVFFFLFFLLADETAVELHVGDLLQQSVKKKVINSKRWKISD